MRKVQHRGAACGICVPRRKRFELEEIREAIGYGTVKMNIDTDMQWAFLSGVRDYVQGKADYLAAQIGNPEGEDVPTKALRSTRVVAEGERRLWRV